MSAQEFSSADRREAVLQVLLQEQSQYREEVRMFDSHFFRVMVTYVTGLVAAFGWLGAQIIERASQRAQTMGWPLGKATTEVVGELARGPFFFLFASIPLISMLMFLFVARDWASLHERFNLLGPLSRRIGTIAATPPVRHNEILRLDRGFNSSAKRLRSMVERCLALVWFGAVIAVSLQLLHWLAPLADTERRIWWLRAGWLGLGLAVISVLSVLIAFLTRSYKEPETSSSNPSDGEEKVGAPSH